MKKKLHAHSYRGLLTVQMHPVHKWLSYGCFALVALTGILFWIFSDWLEMDIGMWRHRLLASHGVLSFILLLAIGGAMAAHVRMAWSKKKGRWIGVLVLSGLAVLIASALLLYYGSESVREWSKTVHLVAGLILSIIFPVHIIWGRLKHRE